MTPVGLSEVSVLLRSTATIQETKSLKLGADKVAYRVKVPATDLDELSFIPGTHLVEKENWLPQAAL